MTLRRATSTLFVTAFGLAFSAACSTSDADSTTDDALVDIPETRVKQQSLGNCWTYSTAAWVESMRASVGDAPGDVAEVYWTYWWWFDQIHDAKRKETYSSISAGLGDKLYDAIYEGGRYAYAFELIRKYGVVEEKEFLPGADGSVSRQVRLETALVAMNDSLKKGALKNEEERRDASLIRAELNRAFKLPRRVVDYLDATFGEGEPQNLADHPRTEIPRSSPIRRARDIDVRALGRKRTLAQIIGEPTGDRYTERMDGDDAWSLAVYPCTKPGTNPSDEKLARERRKFLRRVQRTLQSGTPVPIVWWFDQGSQTADDSFVTMRTHGKKELVGRHASLIDDYEATTPHFGRLYASADESRKEALDDALSDDATVDFLRIKNSWGVFQGNKGYNDLYMSYLNAVGYGALETPTFPAYKCDDQPGLGSAMLPNAIDGDL